MVTKNAEKLLKDRYYQNNENSWSDLCDRVATNIASCEKNSEYWEKEFYNMLVDMDFISSTPSLINAGMVAQQMSSCFIIDIEEDSLEAIFDAVTKSGKIYQKNGGAGFNISILRPENANITSSTGQSCGVTGFMEIFDLTADVITRNNVRKGALKIDLEAWHPDIYRFISIKDDTDKLNKMNISVMVSDEFMEAVKNNDKWQLIFPDYENCKDIYDQEWDGNIESWQEKGYPIKIYDEINARKLYREIMEHSWKTGEPGISFKDHMNVDNPNPHMGEIRGSNPCMEFVSIPYNSCNLGSINLSNMVKDGKVQWNKLKETIKKAVRYLDNMITVNDLPLDEIDKVTKQLRSIGLGTMGYADMLYQLGIPYNSKQAIEFTEELMNYIREIAIMTSEQLAEEKGVYPVWEGSVWEEKGVKMRNSNLLSIAPNGSISFIAGTTGGLEPEFALVYERRTNEDDIYNVVNPIFEQELKDRGLYSEELLDKIKDNNGSIQGMKELPKDLKETFIIASDIPPESHLDILEVFSNYVDLSCSKTINFSNDATVEDIENIYLDAWERGVKGVTVYRDGSREKQTLSTGNDEKDENDSTQLPRGYVEDAKKEADSTRYKTQSGCGSCYATLVNDGDKVIETFIETKNGGCKSSTEAMSRLISLALRGGIGVDEVIDQLKSVSPCIAYVNADGTDKGASCPHMIGYKLEKEMDKLDNSNKPIDTMTKRLNDGLKKAWDETTTKLIRETLEGDIKKKCSDCNAEMKVSPDGELYCPKCEKDIRCPECGRSLRHESGCVSCVCGYSKCS